MPACWPGTRDFREELSGRVGAWGAYRRTWEFSPIKVRLDCRQGEARRQRLWGGRRRIEYARTRWGVVWRDHWTLLSLAANENENALGDLYWIVCDGNGCFAARVGSGAGWANDPAAGGADSEGAAVADQGPHCVGEYARDGEE